MDDARALLDSMFGKDRNVPVGTFSDQSSSPAQNDWLNSRNIVRHIAHYALYSIAYTILLLFTHSYHQRNEGKFIFLTAMSASITSWYVRIFVSIFN